MHIDNKKKDIASFSKCPDDLDDAALTAEKEYSINFTVQQKKYCLILNYNGVNSYICYGGEIYKLKAEDVEFNAAPLSLGNASKDFSVDNMKKDWIICISMIFQLIMIILVLMMFSGIHKKLMKKLDIK